jgi:hypothetical protein
MVGEMSHNLNNDFSPLSCDCYFRFSRLMHQEISIPLVIRNSITSILFTRAMAIKLFQPDIHSQLFAQTDNSHVAVSSVGGIASSSFTNCNQSGERG